MTANPLIGYAFLKVNFGEDIGDLLDLTLPLTRRALYKWRKPEITPEALQQKVEEVWGMIIPQYVLRSLLGKLSALNVVYFDLPAKVYRLRGAQPNSAEIIAKEKEAQDIYGRVVSQINAELIRDGTHNVSGRSVLESFLDSSALSFISGDSVASPLTKKR